MEPNTSERPLSTMGLVKCSVGRYSNLGPAKRQVGAMSASLIGR